MQMSVIQVRLPDTIVSYLDGLVKSGIYQTKSDAVRDAVRKLMINEIVGIAPDTGDSVKEVRAIRKKLSKLNLDINEINKLGC